MKKIALLLIVAFSFSGIINAQRGGNYKTALGIRFGNTYYDAFSFSYKNFTTKNGALELNVGFGSRGYDDYSASTMQFALGYQWHFDFPVEGLKWFVGGGATLFNTFSDGEKYSGFGFGIFPTGGIDYKVNSIPLNLSFDLRPTFLIASPSYYNSAYSNVGLAIRYTIK